MRGFLRVNKVLGFGAVVIMVAAMGYIFVSEQHMKSDVQAENQTTEQVTKQTTKSSKETKVKDSTKKSEDRSSTRKFPTMSKVGVSLY